MFRSRKNIVVFFSIVLIGCQIANGQNYKSIFSSGITRWNVFEFIPDAGGTIVYESHSDTLIGGRKYHVLYKGYLQNLDNPVFWDNEVCGYVYEDTVAGKYWLGKVDNNEFKEALFMDLGLNTGDTFVYVSDLMHMQTSDIMVDTVFYTNGRKTVVLDFMLYGYVSEKLQFIEGIGALNGFYLSDWYSNIWGYSLLCKFEDGTHVYSSASDINENCFLPGGGNVFENNSNINLKVYPNPSDGLINLDVLDFKSKVEFEIFNSLGVIIMKGFLQPSVNKIEIKDKGIYLIKVSDKGSIASIKIIVN